MALNELSRADRNSIERCLEFILRSHALEGEFQTRMGVDEAVVEKLFDSWPSVDDSADDGEEALAINNALNEVVNGGISDCQWNDWFDASREDVEATYRRWKESRGWKTTGNR